MSSQPIKKSMRHNQRKSDHREALGELARGRRISVIVDQQVGEEWAEVVETLGILRDLENRGEIAPSDLAESREHLERSLRNNL